MPKENQLLDIDDSMLTMDFVNYLMKTHLYFNGCEYEDIRVKDIEEFAFNGILTNRELLRLVETYHKYENHLLQKHLNSIGRIRVLLRGAKKGYNTIKVDGSYSEEPLSGHFLD